MQRVRQIQPGVILTKSNKILFTKSPLKYAYPPDGLTVTKLFSKNGTKRERLLTIYRNLIRLTRYLQMHSYPKRSLRELIKVKLRQDYEYKKSLFITNNENSIQNDNLLFKRLVNTVNFMHNATLDSESNITARPVSMEFKILSSVIQYEMSKSLPSGLKNQLKDRFLTLENYIELRKIERSWNMQNNSNSKIWWIENGVFQNEMSFGYLTDLQKINKKNQLLDKMAFSILDFEKFLVLFNEESEIIL